MDSISTFNITKETLLDLMQNILQGKVQLADFQRSWCWDDEHIKRLLANVSLGYPIGAVMLLQQSDRDVLLKPRLIDSLSLASPPKPELLILDGQQRLTALFMALFSPEPLWLKQGKNQRITQCWYYIDIAKALDNPAISRRDSIISLNAERKLRYQGRHLIDCSTPQKEYESGLFPINQVFSFSQWRNQYSKYWKYEPSKLELIENFELLVIKKFEHYQVPVIILKPSLPKEAVCQVFEDINTAGCDLNYFDLMIAAYAVDDFSLREDWEIREKHFQSFKVLRLLKNTDFLQAVTLVATYTRRMEAMNRGENEAKLPAVACTRQYVLRLSLSEYKAWAELVTLGYEEADKFLYSLGIFDVTDLPYYNQLVALAAILTALGERLKDESVITQLKQWYYCAVFGEVYRGWPDMKAAKDMLEVSLWLNGDSLPSSIKDATLTPFRLQKLCRSDAAAYRGISTLLRCCGAVDFSSGQPINIVRYFEKEIENHHIFPQAWCRQQGISPERYNSIINKTPLPATTNRLLGGQAPSDYLEQLESSGINKESLNKILRSHLIDPILLRNNDFNAFFTARTQALLDLVGKAMGKRLTDESTIKNYECNYNTVSLSRR